MTRMLGLLIACFTLASCASTPYPAPKAWPEFEWSQSEPLVVLADVRPGDWLPEFPECTEPGTFCLHSPMWLKIRVRETLYGQAPAQQMPVYSTTHYDIEQFDEDHAPRLMWMMVGPGDAVVMPAYKEAAVVRTPDGDWMLPIYFPAPEEWLPCSVSPLREPVDAAWLPRSMQANDSVVKNHPELFQYRNGHPYPRYGIRLSRLREELARLQPTTIEQMTCEADND